ncbi:MAG: MFS transporter [Candidatus Thermoplasmatota archaeon]|nr:MFS transporter [Candidatus Thermoplasmatota archaeon]
MRRRSQLAIMLVSVALLMSFSVVVASNTNEIPNNNTTESIDSQIWNLNESEGETYTVTVDGTNLRFSPDTVTLMEGDTIQFFWENQLLPHNAVERGGLFDSGEPERNVNYTYTFNVGENGTYEYVCEPHESVGMIGNIIVEPKPLPEPEPEEPVEEDDDTSTMSVGSGEISGFLFAPWFIGVIVLVGFISTRSDQFHLGLILEEEIDAVLIDDDGSEEGKTLVESYSARVFTLCALYVAQGIPWGFITVTFVTYLAAEGFAAKDLAMLLTLGTLPWSVKFMWGPVIDRYQYRPMGRRRPWILIAQTGMILLLTLMVFFIDVEKDVTTIAYMFLVYNIFTSLQDVSTDALAVDILKPQELEKVNGYMFTAKTLGGMIGGAGLGTIISYTGIRGALIVQIPILLAIMMVPLYMRERPGEKLFPWSEDSNLVLDEKASRNQDFGEIIGKVKTAFSLKSTQLGILLSLFVSLSHFLIPLLPLLFLRELDWSQERFNATKGGLVLIITMFGYLAGGYLGKKFGGKSVIIYSTTIGALVTAFWGLTESWWGSEFYLVFIWSLAEFMMAIVSISIYSLMMRITWSEVGGTQFTGYMAMMNLSAIIGYQIAAPLSARFDYPTLFLIAAVFETLIIATALFIDPDETRRELEDGTIEQQVSEPITITSAA